MKFINILKRNMLTILFSLFLFFLVFFSRNNLAAAKDGLTLWATCVVPSLLPFFIATELLNYTNIAQLLGKLLQPIMKPFFNLPGEGAYAIIMGFISGYPVGAKIVSDMFSSGTLTKNEAERLLCFTNNSGPLFIIGTVGILIFGNADIGALLLITHILSSLTVGFIFGKFSKKISHTKNRKYAIPSVSNKSNISDLGNILGTSISKATSTVMLVGGFVVLFSVILSILNELKFIVAVSNLLTCFGLSTNLAQSLVSGIIELTNGISLVGNLHKKNISSNIILCAFLLGFGGLSILLQVLSITNKHGLSIKKYFFGKMLQGLIASVYTFLILSNFVIFNLDIPPA